MAQHGELGRIVIDLDPELKRRLYAALSLSRSTLKDWFMKTAEGLCEDKRQPTFVKQVRDGRSS